MSEPLRPTGVIQYSPTTPENTLTFHAQGQERLRISPEGFFVDGVRVDDPHHVYERFNDWLIHAGSPMYKPTRRKKRKP